MPPKNKYTDSKFRDEVKEEIQQSDKGGAPGQWSARKAQMMAKEYKARGGSYNQPKSEKDESQKHLEEWTKEEWQTKEGSGQTKQKDGSRKRYLPKKAWEDMQEAVGEEQPPPKKRKSSSSKKISGATIGSKHDKTDAPAQQASASRLPKKGQLAHWKAMPGWVDGKVVEIVKTSKEVEGKQVKASKDDPRIVLRSNAKSAKICVHKVDNVYFD